ncbi:hypothetical protein [Pandoraea apista]|uniref:hypothetical protein n=1 Tax=Pandoraea apista TaxID=93218 RepID=UPI000F683E6E|nr:hypothetical protein [Pandoraea apista]RRW87698.1 hypothetical protein EGJ54_25330 [Pandoraea apista]RRW96187.1 hypothetical protein EGJ56_25345 [Pandoraea apista]
MAMKFGRAWCDELAEALTPYRARELYVDEENAYYEKELTFRCEDGDCRAQLTPVGIYMTRKSKRALHFRSKDEHSADCDFASGSHGAPRSRGQAGDGDDYKPTDFPTEFVLKPPKRNTTGGPQRGDSGEGSDSTLSGIGGGNGHGGRGARSTRTKTRYLDEVVDCFLSGDEGAKARPFTVGEKTKVFSRFFKKVRYFQDEPGLIYYGQVDSLKVYKGKGVGLRFAESVWIDKKPYRIRAYIPQELIDASRRKKAFLAEMAELERAVAAKEDVMAFFVGAYPEPVTVGRSDGTSFELYSANLSSVDHLSVAFSK